MDCKFWIDVADVPPLSWLFIAIAALVVLWTVLVSVKLWLTWGNIRDQEIESDEMIQGDIRLVDLTSGEILSCSHPPEFRQNWHNRVIFCRKCCCIISQDEEIAGGNK